MFVDVRGCSWMFVNIVFSLMSIDVHRCSWMFVDVQYLFLRLSEEKTLGGVHLKKGTCQWLLFLLFFRVVWHGLAPTHYGLWLSLCTAHGWYYLRFLYRESKIVSATASPFIRSFSFFAFFLLSHSSSFSLSHSFNTVFCNFATLFR